MTHDDHTNVSGDVTDIFAHRFVVATATGRVLADLGTRGAEKVRLLVGDHVDLWGEMKPSELKVSRIAQSGGTAISIGHGKPTDDREDLYAAAALGTVAAHGFTVVGVPRRKPKHFEILGRGKGGDFVELHVELNGTLRNSKPVPASDHEWAQEIKQAG
jgi:hypothetical protein